MKHLKIVAKGWIGYTGNLGVITFKDGISAEPVPDHLRDRLSAVCAMVEVDESGNELPAGISHRMIAEARNRAPVGQPLERMTEGEHAIERKLESLRAEKPPVSRLYEPQELEAIASKGGIRALREIGDPWNVKDRTIDGLIKAILGAQRAFMDKRQQRMSELSERRRMALEERRLENAAMLKRVKDEQDEENRLAAVLESTDVLADVYKAGDKLVPAAVIIESAWKTSSMTLTGFNALQKTKRDALIAAELEAMAEKLGVELEPQVIDDDKAKKKTASKEPERLLLLPPPVAVSDGANA